MLHAFWAEWQKARRRHDGLICVLFPLLSLFWVGLISPTDPEELATGYASLFYSLPVLHATVLPIFMAVLASRLWDAETKGRMPKLLYTLQSRRSLLGGKILFGVCEVCFATLLELGSAVLLGRVRGYTDSFAAGQLAYLAVCTLAVELMLFFFTFLLMLFCKTQLPALCMGIVSSLLALFSAFMPPIVGYFVPWGYFVPLGSYMIADWDQATRTITYGIRSCNWGLLGFTVLLAIGLAGLCFHTVQKQEV